MDSLFVKYALLLLASLFFSSCGRGGYLFISDRPFAALEGESLRAGFRAQLEIESFTTPPEAAQVMTLVSERRPAGLLFSPLYYNLASAVARLEPEVPVYAVLPPGESPDHALNAAVLDLAGAVRPILEAVAEAFPAGGPESVLLLYRETEAGSGWSFLEKELKARFSSGSVESHSLPLLPGSREQDLSFLQRNSYDLLLILASRQTPGLITALGSEFSEAFLVCDHPPEQNSGLQGGYLSYSWARSYSALLEGEMETDAWEFRPFGALWAP